MYSPEEVINRSDIVLKIAPPADSELKILHEGQTLFSALHLAISKRKTIETLLEKHVTAIGYELIENERGDLPIVQTMAEIAGQISIQVAAHYLQARQGGRGVLLGSIPVCLPPMSHSWCWNCWAHCSASSAWTWSESYDYRQKHQPAA